MGDRANIVIEQGDGTRVWLYGHWMGYEAPEILQNALKRGKERWDDTPYLARIIFSDMTKGSPNDLTGYGITTSMTDNEKPILVVDPAKATVTIEDEPGRSRAKYYDCIGKSFTMEEYCAIADISWDTLNGVAAD